MGRAAPVCWASPPVCVCDGEAEPDVWEELPDFAGDDGFAPDAPDEPEGDALDEFEGDTEPAGTTELTASTDAHFAAVFVVASPCL